ncbi:MAG TPA: hypothetical protein VGG41_17085 [Solirubrobacteraceae bacterium]|jgi:hypothetical protein
MDITKWRPAAGGACGGAHKRRISGLAATIAAAALLLPVAAGAQDSLIAQATAGMRVATASEEKLRIIPFKVGTKFTISCARLGSSEIKCTEHSGPERCVNGKPWALLTDIFPIIKNKVGKSLSYGLVYTAEYCKH